MLAQRLSMVSGVAGVNVFGAQKFAVRIDVDPTQLASRQVGIDEVAQAIAGANVNRPTGTLFGPQRNFVVQTSGQLMNAEGYRPIPVAYRNGSPVRLSEVANVYDGVENPRNASWFNGTPAIYLAIARQPGTNTVAGRRRDQGAAAAAPGAAAGLARAARSAATARSRSASRSTTSSSRCC